MKRILVTLLFGSQVLLAQKPKHIGFLMDDFYSIRWVKDSAAFASEVRKMGHKVSIRVCDSDTALQHQQVRELVAQGVDVLVITPEDCGSAGRLVATAHKSHIPVIAYDRLILNADLDYYISFDGSKVGELQAKFIVDSLKGKGNIMLVNGPKSDQNATVFREGQLKVLKPYVDAGKIKIVYDQQISEWTLLEAMMETNGFLATNTDKIDAVIAANDELAEGVLEAFKFSRPDQKLLITGQDANPSGSQRIANKTQGMTVFKPVDQLAKQAAELAVNVALGKKPTVATTVSNGKKNVPFIQLQPIMITNQNIQKLIFDSGYQNK